MEVNRGLALSGFLLALLLSSVGRSVAQQPDNPEVKRIVDADQADRTPPKGQQIDWNIVAPRDAARLKRIKEIYQANDLSTANDYANAALVLQHSNQPDDFLLAHEMCIVSILKGNKDAAWLAAASEDRFLMNLKRPQRFGTQYRSDGNEPIHLYQVDPQVTDRIRKELHTPTLQEAKAREKTMQEMFGAKHVASYIQTTSKPVPTEMVRLMKFIHHDLLKRKKDFPWLKDYSESCLTQPDAIFYAPAVERGGGDKPQPQAPDQLVLMLVPISQKKGFKYFTFFDHEPVCKFEKYGLKMYGFVVDWDSNREKIESLVKRIVVQECAKIKK